MINPGKYRHVINILSRDTGTDAAGAPLSTYSTLHSDVRAAVQPLKAEEFFSAGGENSKVTHKIDFRYVPGIDTSMIIEWEGVQYEITSPPIDLGTRQRYLRCMVRRVEHG